MSEIVSEAKKALRVQILANRTDDLARQTSGQFAESLLALSLKQNLKRIGCYLSFGSEPATDSFIELGKAEGIEIACPMIESTTKFFPGLAFCFRLKIFYVPKDNCPNQNELVYF
jgi:5-formyltetrahydrofolate cyclo-ligase